MPLLSSRGSKPVGYEFDHERAALQAKLNVGVLALQQPQGHPAACSTVPLSQYMPCFQWATL